MVRNPLCAGPTRTWPFLYMVCWTFLISVYICILDRVDEMILRNRLKTAAAQSNDAPSKIIREHLSGVPSSSTSAIPNNNALRQIIKRERKKKMPKEPTSLNEVDNIPEEYTQINGNRFLGRNVAFGDNGRLLLLATEINLRMLSESPLWLVDGTFQTCPILFTQIFSVHGIVGTGECTRILPLAYGFLHKKTEECYVNFFNSLKEYALEFNIELNPERIMSDFELAIINAVKSVFPATIQSACLFHLGQSIWRKIQEKGLSQKYGSDSEFALKMRYYVALAYFPPEDIPNVFNELKETIFPEEAEAVTDYFEKYYVLGQFKSRQSDGKTIISRLQPLFPPALWSIERNINLHLPRTQNSVEAWHRRWNSLMDNKKLGLYNCLKKLIEEQNTTAHKIERILSKIPQTPPKKKIKLQQNAIGAIVKNKNNMSILDFVRAIAINTRVY